MKKLFLTLAAAFVSLAVLAQDEAFKNDPRYGNSPEERVENVKLLNAFNYSYKLKDFPQAAKELKVLLEKIPASSENLYIRGIDIYRGFLADAKTAEQRKTSLDSILILFDKRAENFANHKTRGRDYVLAQKAMTYFDYAEDNEKQNAYKLFIDAIEAGKDVIDQTDVELMGKYFTNLSEEVKYDEITADEYIKQYEYLAGVLAEHNNEFANAIANEVEAMFANSGVASCENIEKIFKPQYEADPNNFDLVKKILALFSKAKCATPFQMELLEKYYQIDPKPELAIMLAGVYEEKKDYAKAMEYMNVAIENEQDPTMKVSYLVRGAGQMLQTGQSKDAADLARKAMELDPNSGMASFIYANAMMAGLSNCGGENKQYACWLVADALSSAIRAMSPEDPMRSEAQNALNNVAANFPKKADLFMLGLEDGQGYTVNCGWVSGRTTVRGR